MPTITDSDFVIATVVAPTILVEPEKVEATTEEGEVPVEGEVVDTEDAAKTEEGKTAKPSDDKTKAASSDKGKTTKPSDNKAKAVSGDKEKTANKETKKK